MKLYAVRRRVDAYIDYVVDVEASSPSEAAKIAAECDESLEWELEGSNEFDGRVFITLDASGHEIEETEVRDL